MSHDEALPNRDAAEIFSQQVQPQPWHQPQSPIPSPLPSQPLPKPKGGINVVNNKRVKLADSEDEEDEDGEEESDDSKKDDSENKEESDEQDEDKDGDNDGQNDKGKIFFINTFFSDKKVKEEISVKCEDPSPCLVTWKSGE
ncbi:hypothetical protein PIB30_009014 [Stylosanthes scabra]|uniref:Uncharacterized protein n=1 Tax=Stylosanthes scabra TaxID=79078 RepID=A0ABU6T627_9FABA|nr:hypothetical protein [Stylosanthes scabra]